MIHAKIKREPVVPPGLEAVGPEFKPSRPAERQGRLTLSSFLNGRKFY